MNIPSKPASIDVEIHGNFVDGREVEAGPGASTSATLQRAP